MMTDELLAPRPAKNPTITQTSVHTTIAVATAGFWIPPSTSRNTVSLIAKRPNGPATQRRGPRANGNALGKPQRSGPRPLQWPVGLPVVLRSRKL